MITNMDIFFSSVEPALHLPVNIKYGRCDTIFNTTNDQTALIKQQKVSWFLVHQPINCAFTIHGKRRAKALATDFKLIVFTAYNSINNGSFSKIFIHSELAL